MSRLIGPSILGDRPLEELRTVAPRGFYHDENGEEWVLPYSDRFIEFIERRYRDYINESESLLSHEIAGEPREDSDAYLHQKFVRDYLAPHTPYRGLMLFHGLGTGKTRSAVMTAEQFRQLGIPILVLAPAGLKENFRDEILKWGREDIRGDDEIPEDYHLISSNALGKGGILEQLAELGIGNDVAEHNSARVRDIAERKGVELKPPRDMLIIVDEFHNINSAFSKATGTILRRLYPILAKARNCKFLLLTGTPLVNYPFELSSILNVLTGDRFHLYEDEKRFNEHFVDFEALDIRAEQIMDLAPRMLGYVSFFDGAKISRQYPEEENIPIQEVTLSSPSSANVLATMEREKDAEWNKQSKELPSHAQISKILQKAIKTNVANTFFCDVSLVV